MYMGKMGAIEKKVDIIFTGLIRNPELIKKSITDFVSLRKKGLINQIIFSTWDYETDKIPEMRAFFKKNRILLIESKEPADRGRGNINCQMKSLENALEKVDKNRFILKTRADIYINPKFLEKIFQDKENILKIEKNLPNGNIFHYKIWLPYYELTKPFYLADEAYFAFYPDHKLLINYKAYHRKYKLQAGTVHMQRWIEPFLNKYPILRDFIENHPSVGYPKENLFYRVIKRVAKKNRITFDVLNNITVKNRFKFLKKRLREQRYIDVLAAYYSILNSHFYINGEPINNSQNKNGLFRTTLSSLCVKINDPNLSNNFSKRNVRSHRQGQIIAFDEDFIKIIFSDKADKNDLFTRRLLNSINQFNTLSNFME